MRTSVVVIGAGHAGLAMSHALAGRGVDHVVLEKGEVANSWRTQRWDSLRLLTPSWQTRLPGFAYDGDDPDGFMSVPEVIEFVDKYAATIGAPVHTQTAVTSVAPDDDGGWVVATTDGTWEADAVVLAGGAFSLASVPACAADLPASIHQVTSVDYRRPDDLPEGRCLVVGASATGVQLAHELLRSGRDVTVATGEHVRMPRTYRGRDVMWWMDQTGRLRERYDEVDDLMRARKVPSPQLVGTAERIDLDLNALQDLGADVVGRVSGTNGNRVYFAGSLRNVCQLADLKQNRLLQQFDDWAAEVRPDVDDAPAERPAPTRVDADPRIEADLVAEGYTSVLWATGARPDLSYLQLPVFDHKGRLRHDGGVVAPGLFALGLSFLRRRSSTFIHGSEADTEELATQLLDHLGTRARSRAS